MRFKFEFFCPLTMILNEISNKVLTLLVFRFSSTDVPRKRLISRTNSLENLQNSELSLNPCQISMMELF